MSSITYIALRELEVTGYAKSGSDISAAGSDDSFNASVTNISGLLDNQWVLVAGFANAANNGWFQANGNSTSTKVSQDTTTSLVTEGAGPAVSLVGYKRGYGQQYSLDFGVEGASRIVEDKRARHRPIGAGVPETIYWRSDKFIDVSTGPIDETLIAQWREILGSVASGESFVFDRYGTAASPIEPKTVLLDTDSYEEVRENTIYPSRYRLRFRVQILS